MEILKAGIFYDRNRPRAPIGSYGLAIPKFNRCRGLGLISMYTNSDD